MEKFKCEILSWDCIRELSEIVAEKVRGSGFEPDLIIGVTRGGWVPALNLSDLLGIKDLLALKVELWGITATNSGKAELRFPLNADLEGKRVLLVDDLTDTGESLKVSLKHVRDFNPVVVKTATLIHKSQSKLTPDFYAERREDWRWLIFPWNLREDLANLAGRILEKKPGLGPRGLGEEMKKEFGLDVDGDRIAGILEKD